MQENQSHRGAQIGRSFGGSPPGCGHARRRLLVILLSRFIRHGYGRHGTLKSQIPHLYLLYTDPLQHLRVLHHLEVLSCV